MDAHDRPVSALVLMLRSFPAGNSWVVTYRNISGVAQTITAAATCLSA
jgi:hypothetical protein